MSIGLKLLDSLIREGDTEQFRRLSEVLFIEDERDSYEFIANHYRRYGRLPVHRTLEANGVSLDEANEPFDYYLERLRSRSVYNILVERHPDMVQAMRNARPHEALEIAEQMVADARVVNNSTEYSNLLIEGRAVIEEYREAHRNPDSVGITLGYPTLDEITLGAQDGDLIVIVARPSMGKSWTIMNMAKEAHHAGHSMLFVSMEMPLKQIVRRWIGLETKINPHLIRKGQLSMWGEDLMTQTVESFEGSAPVHFLGGNFKHTVEDVIEAIHHFDPEIIYVDAAYLLGTKMKFRNEKARWERISDIMRTLKEVALQTRKKIVITVQFNREVKKRTRKPFDLGSIAGADEIPQIASIVIGMMLGREPHEKTRRDLCLMKVRDGEDEAIINTNFKFDPMDFSEIGLDEETEAEETEEELETGWMI